MNNSPRNGDVFYHNGMPLVVFDLKWIAIRGGGRSRVCETLPCPPEHAAPLPGYNGKHPRNLILNIAPCPIPNPYRRSAHGETGKDGRVVLVETFTSTKI